ASGVNGHAVTAEEGRAAAEEEEQQEDNFRRMHVEGVPPGVRDINHGVEGREENLGGVDVRPRGSCGSHRLFPDLALEMLRKRGDLVGDRVVEAKARGGVIAEELAECRLSGGGSRSRRR